MLGTYLLIRLKEAAEEGVNEGTNFRAKTVTAMEFGAAPETSESSEHSSFPVGNTLNNPAFLTSKVLRETQRISQCTLFSV